ncbi:MAG: tripartite tricarboxylate transporter substrate binding protein [Planctomycetes bacterium]|nr:tripartite tricarboxylate transporter substrate binding protein [Planctomycetota bacterium]
MKRKTVVALVAVLYASVALPTQAEEIPKPGNFPSKPVEIIVPFAAGGGLDVAIRLLSKYAEQELGQRIVVSNKTGGGNIQGNFEGIRARPDGYTIGAWGSGLATDELIIKGVPYTHKDVQPLCMFADDPEVITISKQFADDKNIKNLKDLIEYAKANPGKVTMGMGGNWTPHDFLRLKIEAMTGTEFNRMPFLGGAPALQSAASGNCDVVVPFLAELMSLIDSGYVVPLAVAYDERVAQLPDLPSVAEEGFPGMTQTIWRVLTLPKNTPEPIVNYLEAVFKKTIENPQFQEDARKIGVNPVFMGHQDLEEFIAKEYEYFAEKTREWGIRVD